MEHDHGYHPLTIVEVVRETADARSFVLEVPDDLTEAYRYRAGQFCTFRFRLDGAELMRCYSMSSAPDVDDRLVTTVKRVPGGRVSNHMIDHLRPGDVVEATRPTGVFCLTDDAAPVVAFAGGSGITPVISIIKSALATTQRPIRLHYANRDADSVIFRAALDSLAADRSDRLTLVHHLDDAHGYPSESDIEAFVDDQTDAQFYLCGPSAYMDLVETVLARLAVADDHLHSERFVAPAAPATVDEPAAGPSTEGTVTITIAGRTQEVRQTPGETLLDSARRAGLSPPYSCELGNCATCMARLVEGTVEMRNNTVLEPDEITDGWILTCQGLPTSERVVVVYED